MEPQEQIKYVEVPVIEEVIRHVPRKEIIEVEKRVPKYEYQYVEKIVEVPQVHVVEKQVEVPQIEEVIRHVPVKQVVDVPKEIITYVPKIETKIVEKEVEVPGEVIEVPKPYTVENKIIVPRFIDTEVPTVVAQKLQPVIVESETDVQEVVLREYEPYLVPVDVFLAKPVDRKIIPGSRTEEHRPVIVPPSQFNALVKQMNPALPDNHSEGLYIKGPDGSIPMFRGRGSNIVKPLRDEWRNGQTMQDQRTSYTGAPQSVPVRSSAGNYPSSNITINNSAKQTYNNNIDNGNYWNDQQQ